MNTADLKTAINAAWDNRASLSPDTKGEAREAVETAITMLDSGELRTAVRADNGEWVPNQWAKKAVLLGFRLNGMEGISGGSFGHQWWDKVPSKFKAGR